MSPRARLAALALVALALNAWFLWPQAATRLPPVPVTAVRALSDAQVEQGALRAVAARLSAFGSDPARWRRLDGAARHLYAVNLVHDDLRASGLRRWLADHAQPQAGPDLEDLRAGLEEMGLDAACAAAAAIRDRADDDGLDRLQQRLLGALADARARSARIAWIRASLDDIVR